VMVQPYVHAIDADAEVDIVLFNGTFSHAVKKLAALQVGQGLVENPREQMAWEGIVTPTALEVDVANSALTFVRQRVGRYPVYSRVDIIEGASGFPTVLEIELIDPYLSLDMEPVAATNMAKAALCAS
jgi:hypothetical protein